MASNFQKLAMSVQSDPHHRLLSTIAYNVRRAWMRHPENEELHRLWIDLTNRLKDRMNELRVPIAATRIQAGYRGMKARNEAARLRFRPGGNVHVRNAAEMGVNIKNRRPPNVRNLKKTMRSGQLARPSLFSQFFNGRRSKFLW
jgi:hypothetical protein